MLLALAGNMQDSRKVIRPAGD